ncbi:glycosyl transferase family 2 [Solidesulfovibrio fructosivorans JJ]]|uniref:Glycosyl transferase family 2 n=1 Tax=Solidesulfovibrio fructosivorans JJ] TaxID=596151 RepID=E1JYD0_SOLFR|nr:glycosyltransferase family 2 protein [Solidesulfovibrio fructosivorans]EFL50704.1 glycosyl transferase family 2 [Solidesulfovibrio fructosivorans JJ]]
MDEQLTVSVVIPAHNEEGNIRDTVAGLRRVLTREAIPYELVLVNDNSTDGTEGVLEALAAQDAHVTIVRRSPPRGFGRAVRAGLEQAGGDVIVICMADQSDNPEDVARYYRKIGEGYDCVYGSRFIRGSRCSNYPRVKLVANRLVNHMLQLLFWTRFNDLTNSFKAYRSAVIRDIWPLKACHFNITIELSLNALIRDYAIAQVPISWQGRTWGNSNLHLSEMGRRYLSTMLRAWFEKNLILDDLLEEKVACRARTAAMRASLESRVEKLERRLTEVEEEKNGAKGEPLS